MEDMYYASSMKISLADIQVCAQEVNFDPNLYSYDGVDYLLINFACVIEGNSIEDYWRFYKLPDDGNNAADEIQLERYNKFKPLSEFNIQC